MTAVAEYATAPLRTRRHSSSDRPGMLASPLFEAESISISFGGIRAVDGVTFEVERGRDLRHRRPQRRGQEHHLQSDQPHLRADRRPLRFQGQDITSVPPHTIARARHRPHLPEHRAVRARHRAREPADRPPLPRRPNILAELLFTPGVRREELRHREAVEEVIDFLDLANYRDQRISGLPYGVRKVVELARALCAEPKLLLLDEPASGLNTEETEEVAFWIEDIKNDLGITVIMIEHDMSLVSAVSDRVLALNNGRMLALGTPGEVQSNPAVIEAYLGGEAPNERARSSVVRNLETYYGPITAIRGVSFDVKPTGQIVTILGANGAGKTTILKSVCGAMEPQKGTVTFAGADITGPRARLGGAPRHRPRAGGARDLPVHDGQGQPA